MKHVILLMIVALCACGEAPKGAPPLRKLAHGYPPVPVPGIKQPLRVGGDVKAPVLIRKIEPDYSACGRGRTGSLLIFEVVVDRYGDLKSARSLKMIDPCVERAFVAATSQWKFKPATLHGIPVDVVYTLTVQIHLS
jgi:hypothetical protein